MKLLLIEPDDHFSVLMHWIEVLATSKIEVEVICKSRYFDFYASALPYEYQSLTFHSSNQLPKIDAYDMVLFISLQNKIKSWLQFIGNTPYGIILHNINRYCRPYTSLTINAPAYSWGASLLRIIKEVFMSKHRKALRKASFLIPYSPTQFPILQKYLPAQSHCIQAVYSRFRQGVKKHQVLISAKKIHPLDTQFLNHQLKKYQDQGYTIVFLTDWNPESLELDESNGIQFLPYPVEPDLYFSLMEESEIFCFPMKKETHYYVYREYWGHTKYSGRLREALEMGCRIDAPPDIKIEDKSILSSKFENQKLITKKLLEIYKSLNSKEK